MQKEGFKLLSYFFLLIIFNLLIVNSLEALSYPRTLNYYLDNFSINENSTLVPTLTQYDFLILDMEMGEVNPQALSEIRNINPEIKILAYMTVEEITTTYCYPGTYPLRNQLQNEIQDSWWLKTANHQNVSFWPGTRMLNCTPCCPEVNGNNWTTYFSSFITNEILSNSLWDGYFADCLFASVSWINSEIDCNNDNIVDNPQWLDSQWKTGMENFLAQLRQSNPNKLIVGNGNYERWDNLNGVMFEELEGSNPNFGFNITWAQFFYYQQMLDTFHQDPVYNLVIARQPNNNPNNYQHMRLMLTATLMGSAYFGIDKGPEDHSDTWLYDEYNIDLGQPLESGQILGDNPLYNGSFANLNYWQTEVHYPLNPSNSILLGNDGGNTYAECHINNTDGVFWHYALKQDNNSSLYFLNNENYLIEFRARADHNRIIQVAVSENFGNYNWLTSAITAELTTEWQNYTFFVTSMNTANLTPNQIRFIFFMGQEDGTIGIDDVSIRHIDINRILKREFENGIVLCNPTSTSKTINLPRTYYHLEGSQAPQVNNGLPCSTVNLPAYDGVILLSEPPQPLESPIVTINKTSEGILLYWQAVSGANSYRILSSNDPYFGFQPIATITNTNFLDVVGNRKFYKVIAIP